MAWIQIVGGVSWMLAAVLADPYRKSWRWALAYLLGAAVFMHGVL